MATSNTRRLICLGGVGLGVQLLVGCTRTLTQLSDRFQEGMDAQRTYHRGLELYNAGEYGRAIPFFKQALALVPDLDEAEAHLAWSYNYTEEYALATRHFRQVLQRQPKWEGLYAGLGWSRYQAKRYLLAEEAFRQALELDPRYRDAALGMAYTLFESGQYAEALPYLERLTQEGEARGQKTPAPDLAHLRSRQAWSLFYLERYERARQEFIKGIAASPGWHGLHNGLGWTYLRLGERSKARQSFQRALQLKPDLADAREGLAQATL